MPTFILFMMIMIGLFIIFILSVIIISGSWKRKKYLIPWNPAAIKDPHDPRYELIHHASCAPSGHNMQPWMCIYHDHDPLTFDLYMNVHRLTPHVDPDYRQALISHGTFLEYIHIAGKQLGYDVKHILFPQEIWESPYTIGSMRHHPIMRIQLTPQPPLPSPLFESIFKPDTNRNSYHDKTLDDDVKQALKSLIQDLDVDISIYEEPDDVEHIKMLAWEAAMIETQQQTIMQETDALFRSNQYQKNEYPYGFSLEGQGMSGPLMHVIQSLLTICPSMAKGEGSKKVFLQSMRKALDHTSTFLMLKAKHHHPDTLIRIGRATSRILLYAHTQGLSGHPISQAIEVYPDMHAIYHNMHERFGDQQTIFMLIRIGYPMKPAKHTMRDDPDHIIHRKKEQ